MPRPSMAAQRKEEILNAFEQCILQDSLEATSLEKLAEQAQMKRSILRHYIGNRDDIIIALSERYQRIYAEQWQQTLSWLPDKNRMPALIEMLFGDRNQAYINQSVIGDAIYAQAKHIESVRSHQLSAMNEAIQILTNELTRDYPKASEATVKLVARGIFANYLNSESLLPLGFGEEIQELKQVSLLLLEVLEK